MDLAYHQVLPHVTFSSLVIIIYVLLVHVAHKVVLNMDKCILLWLKKEHVYVKMCRVMQQLMSAL